MCIAVYTLFPTYFDEQTSEARVYLQKDFLEEPVKNVYVAYETYESLDKYREGLSHLIYIECNDECVYGVVQFFGVMQVYCFLGTPIKNTNPTALIGVLDPTNGNESFKEITPLKLSPPPTHILVAEYAKMVQIWLDKFQTDSILRGATHPPDLRIDSIHLDKIDNLDTNR